MNNTEEINDNAVNQQQQALVIEEDYVEMIEQQ